VLTLHARLVLGVALSALCLAGAAAAATEHDSHIRVSDHGLKTLVELATSRSETFRELVAALDAAPVLVFVECDLRLPLRLSARLSLVTRVGAVRYVRVDIACALPSRRQMALLAHEFQHALEIGLASDITDLDSMEEHYESVGFQTYGDGAHKRFETDAAQRVERRVKDELYGSRADGGF
jgi:hypothetical protein